MMVETFSTRLQFVSLQLFAVPANLHFEVEKYLEPFKVFVLRASNI